MSDPASWMFWTAKISGGLFLLVLMWETAARLFRAKRNSGADELQDDGLDWDPFQHLMEVNRAAAASSGFLQEKPAVAPGKEKPPFSGKTGETPQTQESPKRLREIEFDAEPPEEKP